MKKMYTFKEIDNGDDLEKYFRLRYDIYSECANRVFLKENTARLDMDSFDSRAKHYGFMCENNQVGYFRMIFPEGEFCNKQVIEIADKHNLQKQVSLDSKNAPFPFLSYAGVPQIHWNYYFELLKKNEKLVEVSRLILHPAYRDLKLTRLMMDFGTAIYALMYERIKNLIVNCSVSHEAFYKKYYGFNSIDDLGGYNVGELRKVSLALMPISDGRFGRIEPMVEQLKNHGKIEIEL